MPISVYAIFKDVGSNPHRRAMKKYRIITREESMNLYGTKRPLTWSRLGYMDYLHGKYLSEVGTIAFDESKVGSINALKVDGWSLLYSQIVKEEGVEEVEIEFTL